MMLGIVPNTKFVLHDVEEEENVFHLCHHSKKLAISLGLINTVPDAPLQLMQKSVGLQRLPHFQKVHLTKLTGEQSC
jgi:hypothetical protein